MRFDRLAKSYSFFSPNAVRTQADVFVLLFLPPLAKPYREVNRLWLLQGQSELCNGEISRAGEVNN